MGGCVLLDLLIVLLFVVWAVYSGFSSQKKASKSLEEYFLAGKTLSGWKAGISMAATQFAADTPLLVMGLMASVGIYMNWRLWIYGLAFLMLGYIFASCWRRAGVLTDAELTEIRYSGQGVSALRIFKAIYYGTVFNCVVLAMVLVAAMRIAEVFLPWHEWLPNGIYASVVSFISYFGISLGQSVTGLSPEMVSANNLISIMVILIFTFSYSTTGGLRSVVSTDIAQFALAMIGTLFYAAFVIYEVGGFSAVYDKLIHLYGVEQSERMLSFSPASTELILPFFIIIGLQWFFQINSDGTGYLAQRMMACRSDRDARIASVVFAWMQVFARSFIWLIIGVGLLVLYPFSLIEMTEDTFVASREVLFVTGIQDFLPIGVKGLMLAGLLGALASTIDTHLNWGSSYWSNDIYKYFLSEKLLKRQPKNRELVWVARCSNLIILIIALVIMGNLGSIQMAWTISLTFGAGMGSVLVLRWLWERINIWSEVAAMLVSLIVAPILILTPITDSEWVRLLTMAVLSTFAAVVVTYFTPATDQEHLVRFYKRVRPKGFWFKTAALIGENGQIAKQKLVAGIQFTIIAAVSLFLMLIGVAKLFIHLPDQSVWWAWIFIVISLALVPIWWKGIAFEESE